MKNWQWIFVTFTLLLISSTHNTAQSALTVDPMGMSFYTEGDTLESEMTIANSGEEAITYRIRLKGVEPEEERRRAGPLRDEPGETLMEIQLEYDDVLGFSWDAENEIMYAQHVDDFRIAGYEWDGEEVGETVVDFAHNLGGQCVGMAYHNELLYTNRWATIVISIFDIEGENVGSINTQWDDNVNYLMGFAVDHENEYLYAIAFHGAGNHIDMKVYDINDDYAEVGYLDGLEEIGGERDGDFRGRLTWVPEHEDGMLWISNRMTAWQVNVIPAEEGDWDWELIQDFGGDWNYRAPGIGHDGENLWIGHYDANDDDAIVYIVDDGIIEPNWLILDPDRGEIAANEEAAITVTIAPGELEAGLWEINLQLTSDDPETPLIEVTVLMSLETDVFSVAGVVTDAGREIAIEGAEINIDRYMITRYTGEEGDYAFNDLPLGEYVVTVTVPDFLPGIDTLIVEETGEVELNFDMLHATCDPDVPRLQTLLEPDMETELGFRIDNDGNGPLTYNVEPRSAAENEFDPWMVREAYQVEEIFDNPRLGGAVLIDGLYYISGGNGGDPNLIYIMSEEGDSLDSFEQFAESNNGMIDLTWDGELIWGADRDSIYGFTTEGELITVIEGPDNPNQAIAWDSDLDVLWVCRTRGRIYGVDRDGNEIADFARPLEDLYTYGLGYHPDDPDGYNLYLSCRSEELGSNMMILKMNTEDGDWRFVADIIEDPSERPQGIEITTEYDINSWSMIGIVNHLGGEDPDRLAVWHLSGRTDWLWVEPSEGIIEADDSDEFTLFLNSSGLTEAEFEAELVFLHDGIGSETHLPVFLEVAQGRVHTTRTLRMAMGWNLVSINLIPDEEDVAVLMQDVVDDGSMVIMKDGDGNFFWPANNVNDIPGWDVAQGYMIKMANPVNVVIEGTSVLSDDTLALHEGWQYVSYYPRSPIEATVALSGIVDNLVVAKDGRGNFYVPDWGYSNMGNMRPGKGYQLLTDAEIIFVYRDEVEEAPGGWRQASVYRKPGRLPAIQPTSFNHSLLVLTAEGVAGDVGVYAAGRLVGSGILEAGACGIAVWGDDPTTGAVDGALDGEQLDIRLFSSLDETPFESELLAGDLTYGANKLTVIRLDISVELPTEFGIVSAYPNPFNARTLINYSLTEAGAVDLAMYDLTGRVVAELVRETRAAGIHSVSFDGGGLPSGLYIIQLKSAGHISRQKLTLLK